MNKSELLEDYCQRCGETVGSPNCCQNRPDYTTSGTFTELIEQLPTEYVSEFVRLAEARQKDKDIPTDENTIYLFKYSNGFIMVW